MIYTPNAPKNLHRQLSICTPIGTQDVRIEDDEIVGRWQQKLTDFYGLRGRLLVEDFLNWPPEPEQIVRFTAMYAPLGEPYPKISRPTPGDQFRFALDFWRRVQDYFRDTWIFAAASDHERFTFRSADYLEIRGKELVYRASCLATFMELELATGPLDRFRYCLGNDCTTPYFVAAHMKQRYCSAACAESAQAEAKKEWWKEKGPAWLARKREISSAKRRRSSRRHK